MCTAITLQTTRRQVLLGRTMDFSYPLAPELFFIPRGYQWESVLAPNSFQDQYSILGIGQDISPVVLADGVNEVGLAAAALYFPGYAHYDAPITGATSPSVAAVELVHLLLGQCASVSHAAALLRDIRIVGVEDSVTHSVAPLHWILADQSGECMVAEKMEDGLHCLPNPIGVLSNSPCFSWHMANLNQYMNIAPRQHTSAAWGRVSLAPFGQGAGTFGLPGDYTPPSRFVRAAYLKSHGTPVSTTAAGVITGFHLLESVSIPTGAVITQRGTPDYTQYTALIDLSAPAYFFKTYDNSQIATAALPVCGRSLRSLGGLNRPMVFESFPS